MQLRRWCMMAHSWQESFSKASELVLESDICKEWEMGRCTKGEKCRFRHEDARTTQESRIDVSPLLIINDGLVSLRFVLGHLHEIRAQIQFLWSLAFQPGYWLSTYLSAWKTRN
jgi:hypothetical protein